MDDFSAHLCEHVVKGEEKGGNSDYGETHPEGKKESSDFIHPYILL